MVLLLRGTLRCFVTFETSLVWVNYLPSCTICPHLQIMQETNRNCLINFSTLFLSTLTFSILYVTTIRLIDFDIHNTFQALCAVNPRKADGGDGISPAILHHSATAILEPIHYLFQVYFRFVSLLLLFRVSGNVIISLPFINLVTRHRLLIIDLYHCFPQSPRCLRVLFLIRCMIFWLILLFLVLNMAS